MGTEEIFLIGYLEKVPFTLVIFLMLVNNHLKNFLTKNIGNHKSNSRLVSCQYFFACAIFLYIIFFQLKQKSLYHMVKKMTQ